VEGHIDRVYARDVTVNGTPKTTGSELTAENKVVSNGTGNFAFSLTEKLKDCRTDHDSSLTIRPSTAELVHWEKGNSWCLTMAGEGRKTFTAGDDVTLQMQDPLFGVAVVPGQWVVVKVSVGTVHVSSKVGKPVDVGPGQQVLIPAGKAP